MHIEALDFCYRASQITGPVATGLDVGGRDVNGTARGWWPGTTWTCLDITEGPGVDIVADATEPLPGRYELVVSTEMLEHCTHPRLAVCHMVDAATEWVLITCATDGRAPHSGIDGGQVRAGEHYQNVAPSVLDHPRLEVVVREVHPERGDLYLLGRVRG